MRARRFVRIVAGVLVVATVAVAVGAPASARPRPRPTPDTTPPSKPTNLHVTADHPDQREPGLEPHPPTTSA